jgi:uncharacterized protein YpmS
MEERRKNEILESEISKMKSLSVISMRTASKPSQKSENRFTPQKNDLEALANSYLDSYEEDDDSDTDTVENDSEEI